MEDIITIIHRIIIILHKFLNFQLILIHLHLLLDIILHIHYYI